MSVFRDRAETVKARVQEYENLLEYTAGPNDVMVYIGDGYFAALPPKEAEAFLQRRLGAFRMELEALNEFQGINEDGLPIMDIVEELGSDDEVLNSRVEQAGAAFQEVLRQPQLASIVEKNQVENAVELGGESEKPALPLQSEDRSPKRHPEIAKPLKSALKKREHVALPETAPQSDIVERAQPFDTPQLSRVHSGEDSDPTRKSESRISEVKEQPPLQETVEHTRVIEKVPAVADVKEKGACDKQESDDTSSLAESVKAGKGGQKQTEEGKALSTADVGGEAAEPVKKSQISPEDVLELELLDNEIGELGTTEEDDQSDLSYDFKNVDLSSSEDGEEEIESGSDTENDYGWRGGSLFPADSKTQQLLREHLLRQRRGESRAGEVAERSGGGGNLPAKDADKRADNTKVQDAEEPKLEESVKDKPAKSSKRRIRFSGDVNVHEFETTVSERKGSIPLPKKVSEFKQRRSQVQAQKSVEAKSFASAAAAAVAAASSPTHHDRRSQTSHSFITNSTPRRTQPEPYSRRYRVPLEKPKAEVLESPQKRSSSTLPPPAFRDTGIVRGEDSLETSAQKYIDQSYIPDDDFMKMHDDDVGPVPVEPETSHEAERPILNEVHERNAQSDHGDDDFSRDMHAIRIRHQQLRQQMVYESGGYRKTDAEQQVEPIEQPKQKVSRFKAARR